MNLIEDSLDRGLYGKGNCEVLVTPIISALLILGGLCLFALALIINLEYSGNIGWNNANTFEGLITEIMALLGISLCLVGCILSLLFIPEPVNNSKCSY